MSYRNRGGVFAWALLVIALAACSRGAQNAPLETVESLPAPRVPAWIRSVSPTQTAGTAAQIRVIFAGPVVPLGAIGSDAENAVTSKFHLAPAVPGHFRVLTPKMIAFEPEQALPGATRLRVTLDAGLRDLAGDSLQSPLQWTFVTTQLSLATPSPDDNAGDPPSGNVTDLQPSFRLRSSAAVDLASLAANTTFSGAGETVAARASTPSPLPSATPDALAYDVQPERPLKSGAPYVLRVAAGVRPSSGNLASEKDLRVPFSTHGDFSALKVATIKSESGMRFVGGDPEIVFSNAVDGKTIDGNVSIEPKVDGNVKMFAVTGDDLRVLSINPYALKPKTQYTVSFSGGLHDIYGQSPVTAKQTFTTGTLAPALWAPDGNAIFMSSAPLALQYTATNLPQNTYRSAYRVVRPEQLVYASDAQPQDHNSLLPGVGSWTSAGVPNAAANREATIAVPLSQMLHGATGMLAYGVGAAGVQQTYYGTVQLTNLGVFAQWMPSGGFALVQRLNDGAPVRDAKVDVYVSHIGESGGGAQPCATATTDERGIASIAGNGVDTCSAGNQSQDEAPSLLFVARRANDWAYAQVGSYAQMWTYQGDESWTSGKPQARGEIFSDRSMYQPGETAQLTAVCYVYQNGALRADRNATYALKLTDPDGKTTPLGNRTTNNYATFSFPLKFSRAQKLGYYSIQGTSPGGATLFGSVRLAEFKPPNFNVTLALDKQNAAASQTVNVSAKARYLFGTPMAGAQATAHVTRAPASVTPKGWDDYTFGRQWFWPEEQPDLSGQVSVTNLTLDKSGEASFDVAVPGDLPFPAQYTVDTEVTDVSHLTSADTKTFLALPADVIIGVKTDFAGTVGRPIEAETIVADADGKAVEGRAVHLVLQRMAYSGATEVVEGGDVPRNQVRYETVAETDVTPGAQPVRAQLVPTDSGSYRVRANFAGSSNDATATDAQVWVSGPGTSNFGQENPTQLQLKLDRKTYRPGETATLVLASPYSKAEAHLYVVRDRILYQTIVAVNGGAPQIRIPVSQKFFPNAAVEVVLTRRGPLPKANAPQAADSLVRFGAVPIKLDTKSHALHVVIQPAVERPKPGEQQRLRLQLRDGQGHGMRGQFTVVVANDAVLQLSGYRLPNVLDDVFAEQPASFRFADNRPGVRLKAPVPNAMEKGWGYGGGFLAGAAGTRVRTNFQPLAYFNGAVATDANGVATVQFTLPDDLTTWRAMAVAIADGDRFGTTDTTFVSTKPLVTNALLPQFARTGDRIDAGLTVLNGTAKAEQAQTEGTVSGALRFDGSTPSRVQAEQRFDPGLGAWRFPMNVGDGTEGTLQFRTQLAGAADAFRVPLDVRNTAVRESRAQSGVVRNGQTSVPLDASQNTGGLDITLSGSIVGALQPTIQAVLSNRQIGIAPSLAARLIVASSATPVSAQATVTRDNLSALQRPDGGFGYWPNARESSAFATIAAAGALGFARDRGVAVSAHVTDAARAYLARLLADPQSALPWCKDDLCKANVRIESLGALDALGDRRSDFLQQIDAMHDRLDALHQIVLARLLLQSPALANRGTALATTIDQRSYVTGRFATAASNEDSRFAYSPAELQSEYLRLQLARKADAQALDRTARTLMSLRCNCGWGGDEETATVLRALVPYGRTEAPPSTISATVSLDSGARREATIPPGKTQTLAFDAASLKNARNLTLSTRGVVHYTVALWTTLGAQAPGRLEGLRVVRELHRANLPEAIATMDLAAVAQPFDSAAGEIYDVGVRIITDHAVANVAVSDPLPAGFEAVDTTFLTSTAYYQPLQSDWQVDYQEIHADRIFAFAQYLDPGVYTFHYLARSVTPGRYLWPGTQAQLVDAPEEFGRAAFSSVQIR